LTPKSAIQKESIYPIEMLLFPATGWAPVYVSYNRFNQPLLDFPDVLSEFYIGNRLMQK